MKVAALLNPQLKTALTNFLRVSLPASTAFKIKRLIISVNSELAKYDDLRGSLIEELATKNEDGSVKKDDKGNVDMSDENRAEFFKRQNQLQDMDVLIQPIRLEELGNVSITAQDLFALEGIVKE